MYDETTTDVKDWLFVDYQIKNLGSDCFLKRGNNVFSMVCLRNYIEVGNVDFMYHTTFDIQVKITTMISPCTCSDFFFATYQKKTNYA